MVTLLLEQDEQLLQYIKTCKGDSPKLARSGKMRLRKKRQALPSHPKELEAPQSQTPVDGQVTATNESSQALLSMAKSFMSVAESLPAVTGSDSSDQGWEVVPHATE